MKHVIETIKVVDIDLCELQCYLRPNCVSINFKTTPDSEERHECELNNATHQSRDNALMKKDGYDYKGAEVRHLNLLLSFAEKKRSQNNNSSNNNNNNNNTKWAMIIAVMNAF